MALLNGVRARLAAGERLTAELRADLLRAVYGVDPGGTEDTLGRLTGVNRVHLYDSLIAWASPVPGERVLDLGTGAGAAARAAARVVGPQGLVIGVDAAPEAIALARERTPRELGVVYREGRIERLAGVPDRSVDWVVASLVLDDLPELGPVMREVARVLRRGGRFVASVGALDRLRPADAPVVGALVSVVARRAPGSLTGRASRPSIPQDPADAAAFTGAGLHNPDTRDVALSLPMPDVETAWAVLGRTQMAMMLDDAGRAEMREVLGRLVPAAIHLPVRFILTRSPG
jgi:SAM-dependent methyltransferase